MQEVNSVGSRPRQRKELVQGLVAIVFFIFVLYAGARLVSIENIQEKVVAAGILAPLVFIVLKVSTIVFTPLGGSPLYLVAESIFGVRSGFFYLLVGDTIGFTAAFLLGRFFGRKIMQLILSEKQLLFVESFLDRIGTWQRLTVIRILFFWMADAISYAAGLTRIPLWQYVLVTVPAIIVYITILMTVGITFISDAKTYLLIAGIFVVFPIVMILARILFKKLRSVNNV